VIEAREEATGGVNAETDGIKKDREFPNPLTMETQYRETRSVSQGSYHKARGGGLNTGISSTLPNDNPTRYTVRLLRENSRAAVTQVRDVPRVEMFPFHNGELEILGDVVRKLKDRFPGS